MSFQEALTGKPEPDDIKHSIIREYAQRFHLDILVETGTYHGDTVAAMRGSFSDIYSIEFGSDLYRSVQERFADCPDVHLLLGDSASVLRHLLPTLVTAPLFWLDAHFSGHDTAHGPIGSPIMQELDMIFSLRPSVILVDDARDFRGSASYTDGYPTLPELKRYVAEKVPSWVFEIRQDIIRIHA